MAGSETFKGQPPFNTQNLTIKMIKSVIKHFIFKFLVPFAKETTIHGIPLIVVPNIHPLERIFWVIIIGLSCMGAIALSLQNWNRYNANPTVVSIEKEFRNWNNYLPSATGCFLHKTDPDLVEQYVNDTWGVDPSNPKFDYYANFTKVAAQVSYRTLKEFSPFEQDLELNKVNLLELAAKVHPKLTGTLVTFDTKRKSYWKLVMTELGICFAFNNKFSDLLTFKVKGVEVTKPNVDESLLKCHYLNGLCYARYDSDPQEPLKFYVHSHLDVIHATVNPPLLLGESAEMEINYLMKETTSADSLRGLSPSQRKCRFDDEPLTNDLPVYSTTMCYIACRYRIVMRLCGCKPFFYHSMPGKLCDISGLLCAAKHAEKITQPPSELGCQCPQPCNLITYLPLIPKITLWKSGYFDQRITFRWGLIHPTTKYRRDILFGFEDLVVSFGGTLALFLGTSFISFIEIVVFIIEYLMSLCQRKRKKNNNVFEKVQNDSMVYREKAPNVSHIRVYNNQDKFSERDLLVHRKPKGSRTLHRLI